MSDSELFPKHQQRVRVFPSCLRERLQALISIAKHRRTSLKPDATLISAIIGRAYVSEQPSESSTFENIKMDRYPWSSYMSNSSHE